MNSLRPRYETEADLDRERQVAKDFARARQLTLHKLPAFYEVDYALEWRGFMRGVLEVKCRSHHSGTYGTLILSLHKYKAMLDYARLIGNGPAQLVVSFLDKIMTKDLQL